MQDRPLELDNHHHRVAARPPNIRPATAIDHKKRLKCRIWLTPGAAANLRLEKITGVGIGQIGGEGRKARRRNNLQSVICQLLPAPSNLPLWLCFASYVENNIVEKILIRAFALYQAFIIYSAFEDLISYVAFVQFFSSTNIYIANGGAFLGSKNYPHRID